MVRPDKSVRRIRANIEKSSAAAVVGIADALAVQYPDLTVVERLRAAQQLLSEVERRLRAGQLVGFAEKNPDGSLELTVTSIEDYVDPSREHAR